MRQIPRSTSKATRSHLSEVTAAEDAGAGATFLARVCTAWELAAEPAQEAGVRVAHPRTGLVADPHGGAFGKLLPVVRAGVGGRLGSGTQWWSVISLRDEVAALRHLVDHDRLETGLEEAAFVHAGIGKVGIEQVHLAVAADDLAVGGRLREAVVLVAGEHRDQLVGAAVALRSRERELAPFRQIQNTQILVGLAALVAAFLLSDLAANGFEGFGPMKAKQLVLCNYDGYMIGDAILFGLALLATAVWVPISVWIGLRPRWAEAIQPIAQFLAAFPANLLFPLVVYVIIAWLQPRLFGQAYVLELMPIWIAACRKRSTTYAQASPTSVVVTPRVAMAPTLLVAIPFTVLVSFTLNILLRELGAADLSGAGAVLGRCFGIALVALGLYLSYRILAPFIVALTWAVMLAVLSHGMQAALYEAPQAEADPQLMAYLHNMQTDGQDAPHYHYVEGRDPTEHNVHGLPASGNPTTHGWRCDGSGRSRSTAPWTPSSSPIPWRIWPGPQPIPPRRRRSRISGPSSIRSRRWAWWPPSSRPSVSARRRVATFRRSRPWPCRKPRSRGSGRGRRPRQAPGRRGKAMMRPAGRLRYARFS